MIVRFTKMHGIGNDYIYINAISHEVPENIEGLAIKVSDRHFGVGSDGIILILPSEIADYKMRMFNADGSEGKMCGNASRCIAKYLYERNITNKKVIMLETLAGIKPLMLDIVDEKVSSITVDMGIPTFSPESIPVLSEHELIKAPISTSGGDMMITAVSMGNPHGVIFVEDLDKIDIKKIGQEIERNPIFPERANIEFVQVINPFDVKMRVWERGSGETLACGTGACATLAAGVMSGQCDRKITVHLLGGDLQVKWEEVTNHIYMTGDAEFVFDGEYNY